RLSFLYGGYWSRAFGVCIWWITAAATWLTVRKRKPHKIVKTARKKNVCCVWLWHKKKPNKQKLKLPMMLQLLKNKHQLPKRTQRKTKNFYSQRITDLGVFSFVATF